MQYLNADTWEEVLAIFEEGGELAGRWGYLELLRQGEHGKNVAILDGWTGDIWTQNGALKLPYAADFTILSGILVEQDGSLFLDTGGGLFAANDVFAEKGNVFFYSNPTVGYQSFIKANRKYAGPRLERDIDWVGVGLDAGGIVADVFTLGIAGRISNGAKLVKTARQAGFGLNAIGSALDVSTAWQESQQGNLSASTKRQLAYDAAGFGIPIVPDAVSILDSIFYWGP